MLALRLACAILPYILPSTDAIAATTKTTRLSHSKQTNVLNASAELQNTVQAVTIEEGAVVNTVLPGRPSNSTQAAKDSLHG